LVQSRFAETITLTQNPNPNFGESGFGASGFGGSGRHQLVGQIDVGAK